MIDDLLGVAFEAAVLLPDLVPNKEKKGCGKMFYKTEKVGDRRSGHQCTCGNNKWNYLCEECVLRSNQETEDLE